MDNPIPATTQPADAPAKLPTARPRASAWSYAGLAFVVAALGVLKLGWLGVEQDIVRSLGISFVAIVLEALPFVMVGSLVGGFIEVFLSRERLTALLPKNRMLAIYAAGLLGIIFPVCECAVIAVTRRLVRKGIPFSVAVAYLIAGPIVNPIVATSTYVAFPGDWEMVLIRLVAGFGVAVLVAQAVDVLFPGHAALSAAPPEDSCDTGCCGDEDDHKHDHDHAHGDDCGHDHAPAGKPSFGIRIASALSHAADDFLQVGQYLIIGAFAAGLAQTLIPRAAFVELAETPAAGIGLMMLLAVVLNLCSEADAFVAASFRGVLPPAAMMAFMVLGPMLDIKLVAMYLSFVKRRALIVMITLMCVLTFGLMMLMHYTYGPTLHGAGI